MNEIDSVREQVVVTYQALDRYLDELRTLSGCVESAYEGGLMLDRLMADALLAKAAISKVVDMMIEEGA